jgi:zinc protease
MFWLGEEIQAAAFRVHGYHHEIIGDMSDLHTMTRDDLFSHYQHHYMPNNAIAVAVGDFDSETLLARIKELYETIPAGDAPKLFVRPEPEQMGERRVRIERPGTTAFIEVGYRVPAATEPDWFKLELVNSILCGPDGMGGGSIDNKTSRLYKALVDTELAASVDGGMTQTIDPFMYTINVVVRDGKAPEEVEAALNWEVERLRSGDITEAELNRVKKQARALFAYSTERVTMQAFWLAFTENVEGYQWFENYVANLEAVTLDDVKKAAAHYLRPQNRTVGYFIPTGGDADEDLEMDE